MKIISVDPFYLRMSDISTAADGTQDTLLIKIRTDSGLEGWGNVMHHLIAPDFSKFVS